MSDDKPRWGWVPAWQVSNRTISRGARWLFTLFATHADDDGNLHRSLERVATDEGVTKRMVDNWLLELEEAGYVIRNPKTGRSNHYRIIREAGLIDHAKAYNAKRIAERKAVSGEHGRAGAARKAEIRATTREMDFTPPVKPISPPREMDFTPTREMDFTPPVKPISPITRPGEQDQEQQDQRNDITLDPARITPCDPSQLDLERDVATDQRRGSTPVTPPQTRRTR